MVLNATKIKLKNFLFGGGNSGWFKSNKRHKERKNIFIWRFNKKYYEKVYYYCYRHVENKHAAQDLTQEVFIRVIKSIDNYKDYGKFENYLYVIARNQCKDFYKRESNYNSSNKSYIDEERLENLPESIPNLENRIMTQGALSKLSEEEREIIILRFYHDLKIKDIAKIMKSGLSITKYRLKKAIKMIGENIYGG